MTLCSSLYSTPDHQVFVSISVALVVCSTTKSDNMVYINGEAVGVGVISLFSNCKFSGVGVGVTVDVGVTVEVGVNVTVGVGGAVIVGVGVGVYRSDGEGVGVGVSGMTVKTLVVEIGDTDVNR